LLSRCEVLEVVVIGDDEGRVGNAFQVGTPLSEGFVYREEFFVVDVIVHFCGNH
jgi:hypothetical protein